MDPVPLAIGTVRLIDKYELFEVDERSITLLIGQRANSSAPAPSPPTASPPPLSLLSTGAGGQLRDCSRGLHQHLAILRSKHRDQRLDSTSCYNRLLILAYSRQIGKSCSGADL